MEYELVVFSPSRTGEVEFYLLPHDDQEDLPDKVRGALQDMDGHLLDQHPPELKEQFHILNSAFAEPENEWVEYPELTGLMNSYKVEDGEWDELPATIHQVYFTGLFG
jgi:hypothetical protein